MRSWTPRNRPDHPARSRRPPAQATDDEDGEVRGWWLWGGGTDGATGTIAATRDRSSSDVASTSEREDIENAAMSDRRRSAPTKPGASARLDAGAIAGPRPLADEQGRYAADADASRRRSFLEAARRWRRRAARAGRRSPRPIPGPRTRARSSSATPSAAVAQARLRGVAISRQQLRHPRPRLGR